MNRLKIGWCAFLAIVFVGFSVWYGGNGKPIAPEEGAELIQDFREFHDIPPSGGRGFADNVEDMISRDDGKEFYAVNLENHKEGDQARAADQAYAKIVIPLLLKRGGHPVFASQRVGLMLGEYGSEVDRVAVVRYRSLRDMIEMTMEPAMKAGEVHKFAALDHTEVFITRPTITFVHIRLTLALMLLVIGWTGLKLIDLIKSRRATN